jgi:GNAT superfamily N-acetyltransferase
MLPMKLSAKQSEGLSFRPFRKGLDEQVWVDIANVVYADDPNWGGITVASLIESKKSPDFQSKGRFIVELNRKSVGIINAHAMKIREDRKGFVHVFGVLPEFKEKGIEEDMIRFAIRNLKQRGMRALNFWIYEKRISLKRILEKLDFKLVRTHSAMEIDLMKALAEPRSSNIEIRSLNIESEREIEELTWLQNECFKKEFNYHPRTVKEMRYSLLKDPYLKRQVCYFAVEESQKAGYIRLRIDELYNKEKNVKTGFIPSFGVLKNHRRKGVELNSCKRYSKHSKKVVCKKPSWA